MAPEGSEAPNKVPIRFGGSPIYDELARDIAANQGKPISEIYREAWERGLRIMASEDSRAFGVRQKVKRRLAGEDIPDNKDD